MKSSFKLLLKRWINAPWKKRKRRKIIDKITIYESRIDSAIRDNHTRSLGYDRGSDFLNNIDKIAMRWVCRKYFKRNKFRKQDTSKGLYYRITFFPKIHN